MQRISHISRLLVVVLAFLVCQGVVAQLQNPGLGLGDGSVPHPLSELPVPPAAYDVQESSVAADYPNQLSFKLELEYPSKSVLDLYSQHFKSIDWVKCRGSLDDWDPMIDSTTDPSQFVHRVFQHWINRDRNVIGSVALHYYSPFDWRYEYKPAGNTQHVIVIFHQHPEIESYLKLMEVRCPAEKH